MADEPVDRSETEIVERVLKENKLDARRALEVLMQTLVEDFYRTQPLVTPGVATFTGRPNALQSLLHALSTQIELNRTVQREQAHEGAATDASISDSDFMDGVVCGSLAEVQASLFEIAIGCLQLAEREQDRTELERQAQYPKLHIAK
jgi:hypothetical protein